MKIVIEIIKWEDFNPRKDIKSMPWFKLASDIGYSETLFGLDTCAKWLWVFLLSTCAKKISGRVSTTVSYIAHYSGVHADLIMGILEEFEGRGLIKINPPETSPAVPDRDPDESVQVQNGVTEVPDGSVSKKRGEEKREDKNRGEENGDATPDPFLIFNDPVFKNASIEKMLKWANEYDPKFIEAQIPKLQEWIKVKRVKAWDTFFEDWFGRGYPEYVARKNKPKKLSPEIEASVSAQTNYIYKKIMDGGRENPWTGQSDFEFNFLENFGSVAKVLNSTKSRDEIRAEIRAVVIATMDTG